MHICNVCCFHRKSLPFQVAFSYLVHSIMSIRVGILLRAPCLVNVCVFSCSVFHSHNRHLVDALHAFDPTRTFSTTTSRALGVLCTTFAFLIHSTHLQWGVRVQNTLGMLKLIILLGIVFSGLAVLGGVPGFSVPNVSVCSAYTHSEPLNSGDSPLIISHGTKCGKAVEVEGSTLS